MGLQEFLKSVSIFHNCSPILIDWIVEKADREILTRGSIIFEEGSIGEYFYVLFSGQVEIIKLYGKSNEKRLSLLNPGEIFGEMSLFSKMKRTATALCSTDCNIIKLHSSIFSNLFSQNPEESLSIVQQMLLNMGSRLEKTSLELASIYKISYISIAAGDDEESLKSFLSHACSELYNIFDPEYSTDIFIYLYNMFSGTYDLICGCYSDSLSVIEHYEKYDKSITNLLDLKILDIADAEKNTYMYGYPMVYGDTLLGFVMLQVKNDPLSQQSKNLISSLTNLISISVVNIKNREEVRQKQRLNEQKFKIQSP